MPGGKPDVIVPAESASELHTLRAALARTGLVLRFEPALEQAYERDTGYARATRASVFFLLGIGNFWLLCTLDLYKLPHVADTLTNLRDGICAICVGMVMWQLSRLRRLSSLERDGLTACGGFLMACYAAFEASQARDVVGVMLGNNILLVFFFVCLLTRVRFTAALAVILAMLVIYPLTAAAYDALSQAITRNHLALFIGAGAVSLIGNYMLERNERRAYLMLRLSLLQRDHVLAGAEALRELTLRDPLTGLANRRHFDREIGRLFDSERRSGVPVGVLQIDVDFFKLYNDRYGHPMGDVCLQKVSASLAAVAQMHGGLAARIGGEEFSLLLPAVDAAAASAAAEQVCSAVRALGLAHSDSSAAPFVTVSVGVASMRPVDAAEPATLMHAADVALYRAKREGRNRHLTAEAAVSAATADDAAPVTAPQAPDRSQPGPTPAGDAVAQWRGLLAAGLHKLRFPPSVEATYQTRSSLKRQRQLAMLTFGGLLSTAGYVWLSLPLHADIAHQFMQGTLVLCGVLALPWVAVLRHPMGWQWREALFSATASALVLGLLLMESQSTSPGMQSGLISLSLVSIVATLIAAPPMRFSLPPCLLLCIGMAVLTWSSDPGDRARWISAFALLLGTSIYSVTGAYLLDFSNRRGYLLRCLGEAQIAELQEINANLERVAMTDALTGLPNRRHFETQLSAMWERCRSTDAPLALLIIDIDHFKAYNDNYGHLAGDACLQSVGAFIAAWCVQQLPPPGQNVAAFAARMGGEEFGVLLPGHDAAAALATAAELCAALHARRSPHAHSSVSDVLTASIGAACQRASEAEDVRPLLRQADEALYRAKASGRNRVSA